MARFDNGSVMMTIRLDAVCRHGAGHWWPGFWVGFPGGSKLDALWPPCFLEISCSRPPLDRSTHDDLGPAGNAGPRDAMVAKVVASSRCVSVQAS